MDSLNQTGDVVLKKVAEGTASAKVSAAHMVGVAKDTASDVASTITEKAKDPTTQVTVASAAGGGVLLGSGGAATGLVAGGVLGGLAGLLPAILTFGLSIPIGAAIGATCGAATGATVGGASGVAMGGVAGYGTYTNREAIRSKTEDLVGKVQDVGGDLKEKVVAGAQTVRSKVADSTGALIG